MNHDIEACGGKWIDISTFTDPRKRMCSKCRHTERIVGPVVDEDEEVIDPRALQGFIEDSEREAKATLHKIKILVLAAAVSAVLAVLTAILR